MNFKDQLQKAVQTNNSLLCVGLDPDPEKIPAGSSIFDFNKRIIDDTASSVCAYKPNIAFYEAAGLTGLEDLKKTIDYLKEKYPQIPIILDAKRADIPNTARMYAAAVFDFWKTDAVTVYPHLGLDSLEPFLEYKNKMIFLLFKTSNPDSGMFQDLKVGGKPYYLAIAQKISKWNHQNFGIFVGATYPSEMANLRKIYPGRIFLSAGMGAQSAQIKAAVQSGVDKTGQGIIFNASRSIIYAQDPAKAAQNLKDEINKYR